MAKTKEKLALDKKTTWRKVFHYVKKYWFMLLTSFVLAAVTVALTLYVPILTGDAVDLMIGRGQVDFWGITDILKKIGVAVLITALSQWIPLEQVVKAYTHPVSRDQPTRAFQGTHLLLYPSHSLVRENEQTS